MSPNTEAVEAEIAVIGSLMQWPDLREHVSLSPQQFFDPLLGRLYAEIVRRLDAGEVADALTLRAWLHADPGAKDVPRLLTSAVSHAQGTPTYLLAYVEAVRAAHARRLAQSVHADALARLNAGDDVLAVLAESEQRLQAIDSGGPARGRGGCTAAHRLLDNIDREGLPTGIVDLDARLMGLYPSELIVIGGRPSMGKTTLATNISRNIAERGGVVHFVSLDMSEEQLSCRNIAAMSSRRQYGYQRVEYHHLRGGAKNISRDLLRELAAEVPERFVIDDTGAQTVAKIEQSARATRRQFGRLDLIVVDYLQLVHGQRRGDNRAQEIGEITADLKAVAKRLRVPVVALSQLSRALEGREDKRPRMSDLRESGSIEQDADVVLFCYREAYYLERAEPTEAGNYRQWKADLERIKHEMEVITAKQRQGPIGTDLLGVRLGYDVVFNLGRAA